jgi:hypothetical protein
MQKQFNPKSFLKKYKINIYNIKNKEIKTNKKTFEILQN